MAKLQAMQIPKHKAEIIPEDGILGMMDLTEPKGDVEVQIRADGRVLWVHAEGVTILRICRIKGKIIFNDAREK